MPRGPVKRVLIVDDEPAFLELLAWRFKADGRFDVETAEDGEDGLAKAVAFVPDAVVLDLAMPRMGGWTLARELARLPGARRTPFFVTTAGLCGSPAATAREAGAAGIFFKPFEESEVVAAVSRTLGLDAFEPPGEA